MKSFDGYLKRKLGDDYVLLAGGGTKSLSNLIGSIQYDSTNKKILYKSGSATSWSNLVTFGSNAFNSTAYLPLTGGTLSGNLTIKAGLDLMTKSSASLEEPNLDLTIRAFGYKDSGDTIISWKVYSYLGANENPAGVGYMPIVFGASYPNYNGLVFTGSNNYSGTTYSNYWGINTSDPQYLLHVNGTFGAGATTVSSLTTTDDVTISGRLIKKIANYTRGTSPESRKLSTYVYSDKNGTYVGWMEYVAETNGQTSIGFYLVTPTSASNSANKWSGFTILKPSDKIYGVHSMSFNVDSGQLYIPATTGTAPFSISSTTRVPNLNADTVDGKHASDFALSGDLSSYLPLAGGTLTGHIIGSNGAHMKVKMQRDTSNAIDGLDWLNTSDEIIGAIQFHNITNRMIFNSIGASSIYSDAVGKYSFIVGNNELTYNTYKIWHAGNDGSESGLDADLLDGQDSAWYIKRGAAYTSSNNGTYWLKVATCTCTGGNLTHDTSITLIVSEYYSRNGSGILVLNGRKNSGVSSLNTTYTKAYWVCHDNLVNPDDFVLTGKIVSGTETVFNLYKKLVSTWKVSRFTMVDEGNWYGKTNEWQLLTANVTKNSYSEIPSDEVQFVSVDYSAANLADKLSTSRTLWGQSFDGTGNITGNLDITTGGYAVINTGSNNIGYRLKGTTYDIALHLGSGGVNRGIYQWEDTEEWLLYFTAANTVLNYGNVGIGTSSPSYKLHVNGTFNATGNSTIGGTLGVTGALQVNSTIFGYNYRNSGNAAAFIFDKPGYNYTGIGANAVSDQIYFGACNLDGSWVTDYYQKWYFNGDIQASNFYTTSDRSKKQNISSLSEHIRKFQLKDTEKWYYGVIAQEVPEMFRDGEEGSYTVNYNSVLSYYIGILENKVRLLEEKINKLENK